MSRICLVCGKKFSFPPSQLKYRNPRYCSHACQPRNKITYFKKGIIPWNKGKPGVMPIPWNKGSGKVNPKCLICGKVFLVKKSEVNRGGGKFCSRICFFKSVTHSDTQNCEICGKQFTAMRYEKELGKGRFCSHKCSARFYGKTHMRERSWNWKGGVTPFRLKVRGLPEYLEWRKNIIIRDDYTCIKCGIKCLNERKEGDIAINVDHHPISFSQLMDTYSINTIEQAKKCSALWDLNNGRTLCMKCHKDTPTYGGRTTICQYS